MPFRSVILLGAFLLFAVQPLVGRAVLPLFGGSAGVWLACLLFFQIMLLAGYGYVHRLLAPLSIRKQLGLQGLFLALALLSFGLGWMRGGAPLLPSEGMAGTGIEPPSLAILVVLTQTCAFPFLLLSSTSPLVQSWFARVHPERDPYPLYALSNAGNVAGLLAFPLLAEPFLSLRIAAWIFGALYFVYGALFLLLHRRASRAVQEQGRAESPAPAAAGSEPDRRGAWIALSALGTIWLLAGSNHLSRDLAALPLLWLPPLLAYLVSFILAFSGRFDLTSRGVRIVTLLGLGLFAYLLGAGPLVRNLGDGFTLLAPELGERLHALESSLALPFFLERFLVPMVAVFLACCLLHGELARLRPRPERLTRFYFFIALGGALGGLSVSVVAPLVFRDEHELPFALLATSGLALWQLRTQAGPLRPISRTVGGLALVLCLATLGDGVFDPDSIRARDFFGTAQVRKPSPALLVLHDGKTIHGQQLVQAPLTPIGYFGERSGIGIAIQAMQARRPALRIGIVGLGAGSMAGYARATDEVVYFEISPKIIELAGHRGSAFQVIDSSPARIEIRQGDGRLLLEQELASRKRGFDLLMIDAFAGGAIPAHLLTTEAFRTYLENVADDGLLVLQVSHHLPLCNQVGATLRALELPVLFFQQEKGTIAEDESGRTLELEFPNQYMVTAHSGEVINALELPLQATCLFRPGGPKPTWGERERVMYDTFLQLTAPFSPWTDDRHSLAPLLWHYGLQLARDAWRGET